MKSSCLHIPSSQQMCNMSKYENAQEFTWHNFQAAPASQEFLGLTWLGDTGGPLTQAKHAIVLLLPLLVHSMIFNIQGGLFPENTFNTKHHDEIPDVHHFTATRVFIIFIAGVPKESGSPFTFCASPFQAAVLSCMTYHH